MSSLTVDVSSRYEWWFPLDMMNRNHLQRGIPITRYRHLFQGKVTQEEACIEDLKVAVDGPIWRFAWMLGLNIMF